MIHRRIIPVIAAGSLLLGTTATALAAGYDSHELSALIGAKTSMEQAITIAQKTTGGKATSIAFGRDNGRYIYRVKTLTKSGMDKVAIDASTGRVLTIASAMSASNSG